MGLGWTIIDSESGERKPPALAVFPTEAEAAAFAATLPPRWVVGPRNRPLFVVAEEIRETWKTINPRAESWLRAMAVYDEADEVGIHGTARHVIECFLAYSRGKKSKDVQRLRQELEDILEDAPAQHRY